LGRLKKKKGAKNVTEKPKRSSMIRFLSVVRYELLWNIRKKKFLSLVILVFLLPTLAVILPIIITLNAHQPVPANPKFAVDVINNMSLGGIIFLFLALVTVMNSISGEFESGTIVPLLTKPVSRTMVLLGKIFAAFITLLGVYTFLIVFLVVGGYAAYGPQSNLNQLPTVLFVNMMNTFVWTAVFLAIGALSKSSIIVAIVGMGLVMGLNILGTFLQFLMFGFGRTGGLPGGTGVAGFLLQVFMTTIIALMYGNPGWTIVGFEKAFVVTTTYIVFFSFITWVALKRVQVTE
jgi:ABC-type transport system involved in multi-copper enzyme maturation permease subunit